MKNEMLETTIKGVVPTASGSALFLSTMTKTFVIYIDTTIGSAISLTLNCIKKERPLTHDLIGTILLGFGISVEKVIIHDVRDSIFYARLFLTMKNELGTKLVELDTRPSDAVLIALQAHKPVFVAQRVVDAVEDMSEALERILRQQE